MFFYVANAVVMFKKKQTIFLISKQCLKLNDFDRGDLFSLNWFDKVHSDPKSKP